MTKYDLDNEYEAARENKFDDGVWWGGFISGIVTVGIVLYITAKTLPGKELLLDWIFYIGP